MSARYLNAIFVAITMVLISTSGIIDFDEDYSEFEIETLETEPVVQYPSQTTSPGHVVFSQYISSDNCGHCSKTGGGSDAHHTIKQNHPMEFVYVTYMSAHYGDTDTARAGNTGPYNWAWSTGGAPQAYFGDRTDEQGNGGPGSGGCAIGGATSSYDSYDATFNSGGCMASTTNDYSMSAGISQNGGTYDISISYGYSGSGSPAGNMKLYAALVDKDCTGYSYSSGMPHGYNCWMAWLTSGDTYKSKNGGSGTSFESVTLTSNMQTSTWSSVPTSVVPGGLSKAIVIGVLMSGNSVSVGGSSPHVYHAVDSTMNPMDLSVSDFTVTNDDASYDGFLTGDMLTLEATVKNTGTEDYSAGGALQFFHVDGATENPIGQSVSLNNLNVGQSQSINSQFDTSSITMSPNGIDSFRVKMTGTNGENDPIGNNRMDVWMSHDYSPSADTPVADGLTNIPRGSTLDFDVTGNSRDAIDTLATMTPELEVSQSGSNVWTSDWVIAPSSITAPGTPSARFVFTVDPAQSASSGDYDVRARLVDSRGQTSDWAVAQDAFSLMNGLPIVVDPNQPGSVPGSCPAFPGMPTVKVEQNELVDLSGLVCDAETDLSSLEITSSDPSFIAWHPSTHQLEVNFDSMQWDAMGNPLPQGIGITIDDGEDENTGMLMFNVIENGQPRWSSIPAESYDEGGSKQLSLAQFVTDTDSNGNPVSIIDLSISVVSVEPENILNAEMYGTTLMATALDDDAYGSTIVTVRATDTDGQTSDTEVHIHVQNVNDAPRFDSTGFDNLMVQAGNTLELDLNGRLTDVDDDDDEIWATIISNDGLVQYNPISGMLTATYQDAGEYMFQLSASDSSGATNQWNMIVNVVDSVNLVWSNDGTNGDLDIVVTDMYIGKNATVYLVQLSDIGFSEITATWELCNSDLGLCLYYGVIELDPSILSSSGQSFEVIKTGDDGNPMGVGLDTFDYIKFRVNGVGTDGFDYESTSVQYDAMPEPGTEQPNTGENGENEEQSGDGGSVNAESGGMSMMLIGGVIGLVFLMVIAGALGAVLLRGGREEQAPSINWGTELAFNNPAAVAPAAAPPVVAPTPAVAQSVPSYMQLTPGGQYVTGHSGETVYLSPDGTAWTMQADSSFIRTS